MMENQPAYGQEDEIDLVALTFTLLRKYRQILAAALACAIIFGAAAGAHTAWGGAVSQDAQKTYESELAEYNRKKESYEAAKQQYSLDIANNEKSQHDTEYAIQNAQEYAENSVWNNLDPYNVRVAQADLYVTTNYQIQPGMAYQDPDRTDSVLSAYASLLGNSSTLSEVAQQFNMQERYLRELVTVEADPDTHLLAITVMSSSEQTSSDILAALLEQVNAMDANITASVGSHTISVIAQSSYSTVSTELRDAQTENSQNLLSLQTQIDQLQQSRTRLDQNFEDTAKEGKHGRACAPVHPRLLCRAQVWPHRPASRHRAGLRRGHRAVPRAGQSLLRQRAAGHLPPAPAWHPGQRQDPAEQAAGRRP